MNGTTVQIIRHASGDFKVVSDFPLNFWDLQKVSTEIYFDYGKAVRGWPIITEGGDTIDYWVYWFVSPEIDDTYLDHEVLF